MKAAILVLSIVCLSTIVFATHRYSYAETMNDIPRLSVNAVTDPRAIGRTYRVEGMVTSVFRTKQGIIILKIYDQQNNIAIESPIFPSLGQLSRVPEIGDKVEIVGNLSQYKGKPQVQPLAKEHVVVKHGLRPSDAISLSKAIPALGKTLLVGPVKILNVRPFTSKKGKRHLRFTAQQGSTVAGGIMFEGRWTEKDLSILRSGRPILLVAEISQYRGQPSLIVKRVVEGR